MGYKRKRKEIVLRFEDEPGLEIRVRSASIRKFLAVMESADEMIAGKLTGERLTEFFGWFAERIISWNLTDDDDEPVPVSVDYLLDEDFDWSVKLVMAWVGAIAKALKIPPLEMTPPGAVSTAGNPAETSIPMSPVTLDSPSGSA